MASDGRGVARRPGCDDLGLGLPDLCVFRTWLGSGRGRRLLRGQGSNEQRRQQARRGDGESVGHDRAAKYTKHREGPDVRARRGFPSRAARLAGASAGNAEPLQRRRAGLDQAIGGGQPEPGPVGVVVAIVGGDQRVDRVVCEAGRPPLAGDLRRDACESRKERCVEAQGLVGSGRQCPRRCTCVTKRPSRRNSMSRRRVSASLDPAGSGVVGHPACDVDAPRDADRVVRERGAERVLLWQAAAASRPAATH